MSAYRQRACEGWNTRVRKTARLDGKKGKKVCAPVRVNDRVSSGERRQKNKAMNGLPGNAKLRMRTNSAKLLTRQDMAHY